MRPKFSFLNPVKLTPNLAKDLNSSEKFYVIPAGFHHSTLNKKSAQLVFGKETILNLSTFLGWKTLTMYKTPKLIKIINRKTPKIKYDYAVGNQAYIMIVGIKNKLNNTKNVQYLNT